MCARAAQLLLAALFVFVVATVAAFRYLEWWQAILASAATFGMLVFGAKLLIKSFLGNLGNMAKGLFEIKSKVLRGATVQVHSVRPTAVPADLVPEEPGDDADEDEEPPADPRDLAWYEVDATIFPAGDTGTPMTHWDLDDLRLVPFDAPAADLDDDVPEAEMHGLRVVADGEPAEPDGSKFLGPQRLHFTAGLPKGVRAAKFRYYFEDFGRIELPHPLPPAPRTT